MKELIYFILGIAVSVLLSSWFKESVEKLQRRPSWRTFFKCLTNDKVIEYLSDPMRKPDVIIGINNGIVAAGILATNLGIEEIYYYHIFPELDENGRRKTPLFHSKAIDLTNKRILIIDDQFYSGRTMEAVYKHILSLKGVSPSNVARFAVFRYDSPINQEKLEIPSPGRLTGAIKSVPWSFLKEHQIRTQHQRKVLASEIDDKPK